mmetsp:Transcript_41470/g.81037  ORF Transcript_41470/g.81037 Transcript_41470/m.81037 type:complete len:436 (+) Transcript_41470:207-1514(+)
MTLATAVAATIPIANVILLNIIFNRHPSPVEAVLAPNVFPLHSLDPLCIVYLKLAKSNLGGPLLVELHDEVKRLVCHLANLCILVVEQIHKVRHNLCLLQQNYPRALVLQAAKESVCDLQHNLIVLLLVSHQIVEGGHEVRVCENRSTLGILDAGADEDDELQNNVILTRTRLKVLVKEVDHVVVGQNLCKRHVGQRHVPQDTQELHQQVWIISLTRQSRNVAHKFPKFPLDFAVMLRYVAEHLGQQHILGLEKAGEEGIERLALRHDAGIARVVGEVDGECDESLFDLLLGEVCNHVDDDGDAICVGEHALALVVHRDVVQKLEADVTKVGLLHEIDELGDDTLLDKPSANLSIERQVEHQPQNPHNDVVRRGGGNVLEQLAGDTALDHLVLVLEEDGKLLEKSYREQHELRALALKHLHQNRSDLTLLHLPLD